MGCSEDEYLYSCNLTIHDKGVMNSKWIISQTRYNQSSREQYLSEITRSEDFGCLLTELVERARIESLYKPEDPEIFDVICKRMVILSGAATNLSQLIDWYMLLTGVIQDSHNEFPGPRTAFQLLVFNGYYSNGRYGNNFLLGGGIRIDCGDILDSIASSVMSKLPVEFCRSMMHEGVLKLHESFSDASSLEKRLSEYRGFVSAQRVIRR